MLFQGSVCVCCSFQLSRRSTTTPPRTPSLRNRELRPKHSKLTVSGGGGGGGGKSAAVVFDFGSELTRFFCLDRKRPNESGELLSSCGVLLQGHRHQPSKRRLLLQQVSVASLKTLVLKVLILMKRGLQIV